MIGEDVPVDGVLDRELARVDGQKLARGCLQHRAVGRFSIHRDIRPLTVKAMFSSFCGAHRKMNEHVGEELLSEFLELRV